MPEPQPIPPATPVRSADWEAFYRDYRKPGYVTGFEITTKLGGGMFGLVYRARKQSIGKDYAIKFLQVDDSEVRRAVLAELEAVKLFAQIDHPNLVSIEDRGEVDGIPYLVMSFAGTQTLKDRIATDGKAPVGEERDELLRFFLQACRGVAALHERSLVHFDIKPANIFLKGSVARVGDYGLSKLVTHSRGSLSMGRGTPYYMAPEMLQRRGDHRSDIYSLGIVLYELLCSSVPFRGDSEWEVLRKHESEAPALPAHLSAVERAVLQRCLQKDPAARFQSVHDLMTGLGAPASAAQAAVQDGLGASRRPPPFAPAPRAPGMSAGPAGAAPSHPPPLPGDPYVGLRRAGLEALGHAQKIARDVADNAQKIARKASIQAQAALRDRLGRASGDGAPSWFGRFRRPRPTEPAEAAGAAVPPPPRRRRGRVVSFLLFLVLLGVVLAMLTPVSIQYQDRRAGATATAVAPPEPALRVVSVPGRYQGFVTTGEGAWVATASRDLAAARHELNAHLLQLRELAPLDAQLRASVELPIFQTVLSDENPQVKSLRATVNNLAEGRGGVREQQRLRENERLAVLLAAEQLARIAIRSEAQLVKARRLHEFLSDATGCTSIPLYEPEQLDGVSLAEANRNLGNLWLWYMNEVGATNRAWNAYRSVQPR